jgi:hypothetical protein
MIKLLESMLPQTQQPIVPISVYSAFGIHFPDPNTQPVRYSAFAIATVPSDSRILI